MNPVLLSDIKGIGKKRLESLRKINIKTLEELLSFFPVRYEDRSKIGFLDDLSGQKISIKSQIISKPQIIPQGKRKSLLKFNIRDTKGNTAQVVYFNQPYLINEFKLNQVYYFYAPVHHKKNQNILYSPKFASKNNAQDFLKILPIYKKIEGFSEGALKKIISEILEKYCIEEFIPEKMLKDYHLIGINQMFKGLHQPKDKFDFLKARKRLKFNEALKINTGILENSLDTSRSEIEINQFERIKDIVKSLPFKLTKSQEEVIQEIIVDLKKGKLLNRMIEGDVGSGKTIIAVIISFLFIINGLQVAYMAPTEILARQHYETFKKFFEKFNIRVELLTGHLTLKESNRLRTELEKGEIPMIIGTHSLIQENTQFFNLGLIITDEQHRFGVKQRGAFLKKGNPHTLVMSATPIPRTLCLTLYGDLDVSFIKQMPKGRKKVITKSLKSKELKIVLDHIKKEVDKGHQAFIVCPLINESESLSGVASVENVYKSLKDKLPVKLDILHGDLSEEKKQEVISRFENREIDVLITTSIIEVGIDVPNVSIITILSADRFGLSQLHQLRGRTGRSSIQSYCYLVSDSETEETKKRLNTIVNTQNGHKIAKADLVLRGPGEYFGFKQHGFNNIKYVDPIRDQKIFNNAKEMVRKIMLSPKGEEMICFNYLKNQFIKDTELISMN